MDFQDPPKSEKVARNPNNFNILKGGKVDPRSKLYQRSVAGREQLKDYLSRLSNSGADEADVFMAGVKSLMNRGHGYVGAYLDSKNPGRRYEKNQAMAITDKVMTDEGIGENPGARLTRPKVTDEEGKVDKEATKEARDKRKEANLGRGSGPQQAPGPSAKPVGQQRKEGKRESTGEALEDSRREGVGDRRKGPVSEWQNTLKSRLEGEASTQDVLSAFQKQYQSQIGGKKRAAPGEGAPGQPPAGGAKPSTAQPTAVAPGEQGAPGEERQEPAAPQYVDRARMSGYFKELTKNHKGPFNENVLEDLIDKTLTDNNIEDEENQDIVRDAIIKRFTKPPFNFKFASWSGPSGPPADLAPKQETAQPEQPAAAPEAKTPQEAAGPESASTPKEKIYRPAAKGQFEGQVASDIDIKELTKDDLRNHHSYEAAMRALRSGRGMFGRDVEGYEWGVSRGLPPTPDKEDKIIASRNKAAAPQGGGEEVQEPTAAAPKKPGGGLNIPKQPSRKGGGGFTPEIGKQATDTIRQAVSQGKSKEEVVEQFKQGTLFPGGLVTDTAQTNPLEGGSTPSPTSPPEELAPSSGLPGEGRPTPQTAKAGQPGQQGMFRSGTTSPRTGSGFGKPAAPSKPVETPEDRVNRMEELTKGGMSSDAALNQMIREGSVTPRTTRGRRSVKTAPDQGGAKKTPIMDDVVRGAGNISRNIGNAINRARERHNNSPGGKLFQVSEEDRGMQMSYDEFSQSVRSIMR